VGDEITYCIKKHSVPSSGRKDRTLDLLRCRIRLATNFMIGVEDPGGGPTHKLFKAIQSFSGTMPYQQLPPQFAWSQRRTPPRLRLVRGEAEVVVVVVAARRRVVRRTSKEKEGMVRSIWSGVVVRLGLRGWSFRFV
jgi:hypothetical protein